MNYKVLNKNIYYNDKYSIVPIRFQDRYDIMRWRNEQIYHLRQTKPLTKEKQDWYFENVVRKIFELDKPDQILFSLLKEDKCIGYGGLVHINWVDKNAEISFIMDTKLENQYFNTIWSNYLNLIEEVAFEVLSFHKIYTYAYDLRPQLFKMLSKNSFKQEATLIEHTFFEGKYIDVLIHSKWNRKITLRTANIGDLDTTFKWVNSREVRSYSFNQNPVTFPEHKFWFTNKINSNDCLYLLAEYQNCSIGSFRCDHLDEEIIISFLLDPSFQAKGFGKILFKNGVKMAKHKWPSFTVVGFVMAENIASKKLFESNGFEKIELENGNLKYILKP